VSTSYLESSIAEAATPQTTQPVVIDPNLRNELSQVMAMSSTTTEQTAIKDPFNDRSGLAGLKAVQQAVAGTVTTTGGPSGTAGPTNIGGPGGGPGGPGSGPPGPSAPVLSANEATKQRYAAWLGRAQLSDIALDPRVFAVDDLLPVGVVDGGSGQQEVLFYSEAAARTFSFPKGTMFFDGWLSDVREDGAVFAFYSDNGRKVSEKLRSWARSLRTVG
jgi:hypothetical protein